MNVGREGAEGGRERGRKEVDKEEELGRKVKEGMKKGKIN